MTKTEERLIVRLTCQGGAASDDLLIRNAVGCKKDSVSEPDADRPGQFANVTSKDIQKCFLSAVSTRVPRRVRSTQTQGAIPSVPPSAPTATWSTRSSPARQATSSMTARPALHVIVATATRSGCAVRSTPAVITQCHLACSDRDHDHGSFAVIVTANDP